MDLFDTEVLEKTARKYGRYPNNARGSVGQRGGDPNHRSRIVVLGGIEQNQLVCHQCFVCNFDFLFYFVRQVIGYGYHEALDGIRLNSAPRSPTRDGLDKALTQVQIEQEVVAHGA